MDDGEDSFIQIPSMILLKNLFDLQIKKESFPTVLFLFIE